MKGPGMDSKGTMTYKMEVGGLWLTSNFEGEFAGQKFHGKGLDSYDAGKKKYVGVWVDNMVTSPLIMEGTYDKDKKQLTMTGGRPEPGRTDKFKSVTTVQGRRQRRLRHVHGRRQGAGVHDHLQAEEVIPPFLAESTDEDAALVLCVRPDGRAGGPRGPGPGAPQARPGARGAQEAGGQLGPHHEVRRHGVQGDGRRTRWSSAGCGWSATWRASCSARSSTGKGLDSYDADEEEVRRRLDRQHVHAADDHGGDLRQGQEDADHGRRRARDGRQADEVQVGVHDAGRRHDQLHACTWATARTRRSPSCTSGRSESAPESPGRAALGFFHAITSRRMRRVTHTSNAKTPDHQQQQQPPELDLRLRVRLRATARPAG